MKRSALPSVAVLLSLQVFAGDLAAATPLTTLHIFHDTDGEGPVGGLVQGANGSLYGVTTYGGA